MLLDLLLLIALLELILILLEVNVLLDLRGFLKDFFGDIFILLSMKIINIVTTIPIKNPIKKIIEVFLLLASKLDFDLLRLVAGGLLKKVTKVKYPQVRKDLILNKKLLDNKI